MRSKSVTLRDVTVQCQVSTAVGESVCICGNTPELGEWRVSRAIILTRMSHDGDIWSGVIKVPDDRAIQFRYMICIIIDVTANHQENIVRRWESHLRPRILSPGDVINGKAPLSVFGIFNGLESVESGWLTAETIVQMKLFNNPVTIWKRRYRDKPLSIRISIIDICRKDSEISQSIEDDSTLPDGISRRNWPIIEIATMNEQSWQFASQSQFGHIIGSEDYIIFQTQMIEQETIASFKHGGLGL